MESPVDFVVRPPRKEEVPAVARLAAELVRLHHAFDPQRFMLLEPLVEGYTWFLGRELEDPNAVVLAAVRGDEVIGYAYGRLEARDWNQLMDTCGALHDIFIDARHRRHAVARALADETFARLRAKGAPRIILHTAWQNEGAQRFFEALGFRRTMVEMTREEG
jgi:ribosomal protein S18 acetylase RimI-like enzyme